ncbi:mannose-6-phosphate isomerase, class I [Vibrio diabolicus]|uniref:mannose-6-phosphate isomerase, class I n=1 Tax=Vibrio diabolicus TaxID=50719 RepID=UPI00375113B7
MSTKKNLFKLENTIQTYKWGSKTSIQELFDIENIRQEPQAEIWMGAHPNGCSKVQLNGKKILLSELIDSDKEGFLSSRTASSFGELPYLFKILAASNALSIQVHPSKEEAELGFAKENRLGIDRKHPRRNYRDANHKPELVYALTSYQAMNGFRNFREIISLFSRITDQISIPQVHALVTQFENNLTTSGLETFFVGILSLTGSDKLQAIDGLLTFAHECIENGESSDEFTLILELANTYPGDIGLFAPLILNVLTLQPGEAMYLDARTPHAYLKGTGLEVMANSDNVLRAGLTPKHIDVKELASCTLFEEKPKNKLLIQPSLQGNTQSYSIPVPDFEFDCLIKAENEKIEVHSAEIVFAIDSDVNIYHESGESLVLKKGESVFIPAYAREYTLSSEGRIARVYN